MFSRIDLSQAYQQVPLELEEGSQQYVVINTQKGLLRYTKLPFGVSLAPGIFKRVMESLMQGLPGVTVYINDTLVADTMKEEHLKRLEDVVTQGRTLRAEEQMPIHEVISGCRWTNTLFQRKWRQLEGSQTPESQRNQVLLGTRVVLQQILPKPVISSCPSVLSTQ